MPSTYSDNLRLELIGAGEQSGTWNLTTNRNLGSLIEQAITGVGAIDVSTGDYTLTALNSAVDEARNATLIFTGTPTDDLTVTVPAVDKLYTVYNDTGKNVTLSAGGTGDGSTYVCPPAATSKVSVTGSDKTFRGFTISDEVASALAKPSFATMLETAGAAPLESPVFTGIPEVPTADAGTDTEQAASCEFVINNAAPKFGIIMWSPSMGAVPDGWHICDGTGGTIDLRGYFVMGASTTYAADTKGGSADAVVVSHNHGGLTGGENRSHTHSGTTAAAGNHNHTVTAAIVNAVSGGQGSHTSNASNTTQTTSTAGNHAHSFSTGGESVSHQHGISADGVSGAGKNLPPYYALYYIMKVQ
jgi:hypothetical protein